MTAFIVILVIKKPLLYVVCLQNRGGEKIMATTMCLVIRLRKRCNLVWTCEILLCGHAEYLGQIRRAKQEQINNFSLYSL